MYKYLTILFIPVLILACNSNKNQEWPADLAGKKALLKTKLEEAKKLEKTVLKLRTEIAALDTSAPKEKITVNIDTLEETTFRRYIDLQGVVMSEETVNAGSDIGGRIVKLYVQEGTPVNKGQLIATTDADAIEKQKEEIQKALELSRDVYERQKRLWEQKIGSEVQYLQAQNTMERLEKSLAAMEVQYRKRNVFAPISGVVDMKFLKEGEIAGPGTPIVQILNSSKVKVVSDVPESYLGKVKKGDKVLVHFPALGKEQTKPVSMLGRTIDPSNRTFKLEVKVDNAGNELKPNLLSVIKLNDYTLNNALVVPLDLIQQEVSGKKYIYLATNENNKTIVKKSYVNTGESGNGSIVITEGIAKGDILITKGARNITDGQEIVIQN